MAIAAPQRDTGTNRPPLVTTESLAKDYAYLEISIAAFEKRIKDAPFALEDDEDLETIAALVKDLREERRRINDVGEAETKPYYAAHRIAHAFFNLLVTRLIASQEMLEKRAAVYLDKKAEAERKRRARDELQAREQALRKERAALAAAQAGKPEESKLAMAAATAAHDRADGAALAVAAKPADLARTQMAAGTASVAEEWQHEIVDWNGLDWTLVGPFIRPDEADKAIRALMRNRREEIKAGKFLLAGVRFKRVTSARFR